MNGCRVNPAATMLCWVALIAGLWCLAREVKKLKRRSNPLATEI